MPVKVISISFVLFLLIVSCTSTPEIVTETVVRVVTVEIEVTRLIVETVEVTRAVYIIDEVAVEVTRLVEIEPAASSTVEPPPEPTMTSTAAAAKAPDPPDVPEEDEVLHVALRSGVTGVAHALDHGAPLLQPVSHALQHVGVHGGVPDHAALAHALAPRLELGLDQDEAAEARAQAF